MMIQGQINASAVSSIYWLPNSENLFIAAHMDGSLVVYDKEKEDAMFVSEEMPILEGGPVTTPSTNSMEIKKSVQSRNQKTNPVAYWKVSRQKINCIAFSPDGTHLAVASEDGTLRIIDFLKERQLDVYRSYYGGFTTVTWSPDGRYILTGSQDDLVSIWSFADRCLVARCQGHNSWVTDVKFDPWRCDERNYRFGSVGEDCRLLLWDFSVGMLGRPKAVRFSWHPCHCIGMQERWLTSLQMRGSIASSPVARKESHSIQGRMRSSSNLVEQELTNDGAVLHGVDPRASTAVLPPVMVSCRWFSGHPSQELTVRPVKTNRRASLELVRISGRLHSHRMQRRYVRSFVALLSMWSGH